MSGIGTVHKIEDETFIDLSMDGEDARLKVKVLREDRDEKRFGVSSFPGQYRGWWECEVLEAKWPE